MISFLNIIKIRHIQGRKGIFVSIYYVVGALRKMCNSSQVQRYKPVVPITPETKEVTWAQESSRPHEQYSKTPSQKKKGKKMFNNYLWGKYYQHFEVHKYSVTCPSKVMRLELQARPYWKSRFESPYSFHLTGHNGFKINRKKSLTKKKPCLKEYLRIQRSI